MIAIVDYNLGNVGSIYNMLKKIGEDALITSNPQDIKAANKIILPGVGSFDNGIENLKKLNLIDVLNETVLIHKTPILGICLGMQLMTVKSEEGNEEGLAWFPLRIKHFKNTKGFKGTIPITGWNYVMPSKSNLLLDRGDSRFYFVHTYHCETNEFQIIEAKINEYKYCAAIQKDNIFGVQFHPEKSHKFGLDLLRNFCNH